MTGKPPTLEEVPEKERGGLGLEILKDNDWVHITDKEEVESLMRNEEGNDTDEPQEPDLDMEFEEEVVDDPVRTLLTVSLLVSDCNLEFGIFKS